MSGSKPIPPARSATIDDCVRLWSYLTRDYIPDLRLEVQIVAEENKGTGIRVTVCDYATLRSDTMQHRSVWAYREFFSPLYLISISQLFDLLISAHRVIEEYFSTGVDNRPRPAKG